MKNRRPVYHTYVKVISREFRIVSWTILISFHGAYSQLQVWKLVNLQLTIIVVTRR